MHIRSRTHLKFVSLWRSFGNPMRPLNDEPSTRGSPLLVFTAISLTVLLTILEVDAHRSELQSLGLLTDDYFLIQSSLLGP